MSIKTVMKNLAKAQTEYQRQLKTIGSDTARGLAEMLAEHIPDGFVVHWRQYTPYFNDGDACTFSVHDAYIRPVDKERDRQWEDDHDVYLSNYKSAERAKELGWSTDQYKVLVEAWEEISNLNDMMLAAFGDHTCVEVHSDGSYDCGEFSHD